MKITTTTDDRALMRLCLDLAARGAGYTSPNPMVGAILVKSGRIIGEGWHKRCGGPHAEIECLRSASEDPRGASMYVNLEPCSHHGRTPACAPALIEAGIRKVVIAMRDPNPLVNGHGVRLLRAAGLTVSAGVLEEEAAYFNRHFVTHITERRPYVHVKVAQSLDGKISGGRRRWISSAESRLLVHRWRATHDAVLVGASTIHLDHPSLNVRGIRGRHPHIVVLDGALHLTARDLRFPAQDTRRVILCTTSSAVHRRRALLRSLARQGVELFAIPAKGPRIAIDDLVVVLYESGIRSVLVEGGNSVFSQFARSGIVDEWSVVVAPKTLGEGLPAFDGASTGEFASRERKLETMTAMSVGEDVILRAFRKRYSPGIVGV